MSDDILSLLLDETPDQYIDPLEQQYELYPSLQNAPAADLDSLLKEFCPGDKGPQDPGPVQGLLSALVLDDCWTQALRVLAIVAGESSENIDEEKSLEENLSTMEKQDMVCSMLLTMQRADPSDPQDTKGYISRHLMP